MNNNNGNQLDDSLPPQDLNNPLYSPQLNPQFDPQFQQQPQDFNNPQYNPQLQQPYQQDFNNPQYSPQLNPQFDPQFQQQQIVEQFPTQVSKGKLTITAYRAFDLVAADMNGFSDPYLTFTFGEQILKTKVIYKNLNPEWNEVLNLEVENVTQNSVLHVRCFDKDRVGKDDFLGEVTIFFAGLRSDVERKQTYTLEDTEKGSIEVGITADFSLQDFPPLTTIPNGVVSVNIIQGRKLIAADVNGKSDPFAVIIQGTCSQKTKIIDKTLDPVWNERFFVPISNVTQKSVIPIMVFDHDNVGSDEFIGIAFIPLAGHFNGDSVKKWYPLYGVKRGEIEIETTVDFDLPNVAPVLYEEVIRKAAKRTKASIKILIKMQKKEKSLEKKEKKNTPKTPKYKPPKLSKGTSARQFKRGLSKGLRKVGTGLLIFGAIVIDILVALA